MVRTELNETDLGLSFSKPLGGELRYAGITPLASEIPSLKESLLRGLANLDYKDDSPCLWVVLLGGTGTGKSTIFNALCGKALSATGVERPKTSGPIAQTDVSCHVERGFPFPDLSVKRLPLSDSKGKPASGKIQEFLILEDHEERWPKTILVDTPDLDSVEGENRFVSERFYLISDVVVFVASQEKYADLVPHQFLQRVIREGKPFHLLVNKAHPELRWEDVAGAFPEDHPATVGSDLWLIPYVVGGSHEAVSRSDSFERFLATLKKDTAGEQAVRLKQREISRLSAELKEGFERLIHLLQQEKDEAQTWLRKLDDLFQKTTADLLKREKEHFASKSRDLLKEKVRALFLRYDPLAKPRKLIREIILFPLRLVGLGLTDREETRNRELQRVAHKIDLSILRECIHQYNRLALEKLSPKSPDSPLFVKLREPDITLADEEMAALIRSEQESLAAWLEETFETLAREIPKGKRWGIYSTSILWGLLIISFETVIGGGFTVLDAFLNSAIAPFLTKGAAELFAYQEIQRVARKMAKRYEAGLVSIVRVQRDRYETCLRTLVPSDETLEELMVLLERLKGRVGSRLPHNNGSLSG